MLTDSLDCSNLQGLRSRHPADVNTQHVYSVGGARALRLRYICEDITGPGGGKQCTQWFVKHIQVDTPSHFTPDNA